MVRVDVIDWKIIGTCNLKCLHCYGPPKEQRALDISTLLSMSDKIGEMNPEWVVMTGGEPLLVKGIEKVLERITSYGTKIALSTNTSYFRKFQDVIENYVSSLNIPLDGSTPEVHAR